MRVHLHHGIIRGRVRSLMDNLRWFVSSLFWLPKTIYWRASPRYFFKAFIYINVFNLHYFGMNTYRVVYSNISILM
jgi:hypothetical protein